MNARRTRVGLLVSICLPAALAAAAVSAQTVETVQTLDRIAVFSKGEVGEMAFDKPDAALPFELYGAVSGSSFQACKLTATFGLFCLDGNSVRRWANPMKGAAGDGLELFNCGNVLDLRACTGLTVDQSGAIWLAGQNKRKTHTLVKVVKAESTDPCAAGWAPIGDYKACSWASGRPLLLDITSIDGKAADGFKPGPGIVGLEERKTVTFFPADGTPARPLGSGKTDWGLAGNEQLLSVAALPGTSTVVVTTNKGRILSRDVASGTTLAPRDIVRGTAAQGCPVTAEPMFGIRASDKTGYAYITDRERCETIALNPAAGWVELDGGRLSTAPYSPEGPSIAPGIGVDMGNCDPKCQPVQGAFFKIPDATLVDGPTGLTLFQIVGIPDCRWDTNAPGCDVTGDPSGALIVDPDGTGDPAAQYLNVRPLLPEDVQQALAASGIPDDRALLISPTYRGQMLDRTDDNIDNSFRQFDAFFGVPEEGVRFEGTFEFEFFVDELVTGVRDSGYLGCVLGADMQSKYPNGYGLDALLRWDVSTKVSETNISADGQQFDAAAGRHIDTLINTGCGSSRTTSFGWSMVAYNLEITPNTYDPDSNTVCEGNDAVFGRLLAKLYDDLGVVTDELACDVLDPSTCSTLNAQWANGKDKLNKCLEATYTPKTSSGDQNCQSFLSQFSSFVSTVEGTLTPSYTGDDPENRRGELLARTQVIQHVYVDKFVPSLLLKGFFEDESTVCKAP